MPQLRSLDVDCHVDVSVCRAWQRLPQLSSLTLCLTHPSSQLSRFLFQHLTSLTVDSIHSRDLAALDCPQLQTLTLSELQVDCAGSLRACASGILEHCNAVSGLLTYNQGQEFKAAAAGAGVRQLGPPPSASMLLEALAPWQPRSGEAIESLELWHLSDVTREALEWLPVNIKYLTFVSCHLLPGALSSVATRLTQLTCLDLTFSPVALVELQLLAAMAKQGFALSRQRHAPLGNAAARVPALQAEAFTCPHLANLLWALSVMRVVDRQLVERVAELLLQGPLAGTGLGAGGVGVSAAPGPGPSPSSSLDSCDDLLPRSSAASLLQQLGWVEEERQRLGREQQLVWAQQQAQQVKWPQQQLGVLLPSQATQRQLHLGAAGLGLSRARYHHHQLYDKLGEAVLQGLQGSHLMPRLQQASRAAPPKQQQQQLSGSYSQQLSSTCLVQLLWAFASHEHCQAALLRAAAPVLSARILQGQLSSRRVACVAWAYALLQQLEPRLVSAILRHSMAHAEQYELRYWARLAWAFSTLGLASEEAFHQRLARLMQERQQQLQRPTPAAGAVAVAQRPSRLQQRGRGHTAAPAARPGTGQGPKVGLEGADEQDWMARSKAHGQLLL
ncbi:hypothetical protein V8C86DRAFT_3141330 [Haematococcus lacustris]